MGAVYHGRSADVKHRLPDAARSDSEAEFTADRADSGRALRRIHQAVSIRTPLIAFFANDKCHQ